MDLSMFANIDLTDIKTKDEVVDVLDVFDLNTLKKIAEREERKRLSGWRTSSTYRKNDKRKSSGNNLKLIISITSGEVALENLSKSQIESLKVYSEDFLSPRSMRKLDTLLDKVGNSAKFERSLMTSGMRYDVLKRDNFTCQYCGATAKDGTKLHVDHIYPISRGGKTEMSNLQALCETCNRGKGTKI